MKRQNLTLFLCFLFVSPSWGQMDAVQQFEGFNLQGYTDEGEKSWDVVGDTADIVGDMIEVTNVDANQYGEQEMNLKARKGIIDKVTGDIQLEGNVVITSIAGGKLTTDSLTWQKEQDLVSTEDPVEITNKAFKAEGMGLRARPGLKVAQMNKNVKVKVKTDPGKKESRILTVTCDGPLEIEQLENMATFNKNVVALQEGRTLKADKMVLYLDPETKEIDKLICLGNVAIIQGENETYSRKAVYSADTKKLVLSGRPKLIMVSEDDGGFGNFDMGKTDL